MTDGAKLAPRPDAPAGQQQAGRRQAAVDEAGELGDGAGRLESRWLVPPRRARLPPCPRRAARRLESRRCRGPACALRGGDEPEAVGLGLAAAARSAGVEGLSAVRPQAAQTPTTASTAAPATSQRVAAVSGPMGAQIHGVDAAPGPGTRQG